LTNSVDLSSLLPLALASSDDGVWVASPGVVQRRDPETGAVLVELPVDVAHPSAAAAGGGLLVVVDHDGTVIGVDTTAMRIAHRAQTLGADHDVAVHGMEGWVASRDRLIALGPDGQVPGSRTDGPAKLAADDHGLWWMVKGTAALRNGDRTIDVPGAADASAMVACAGLVWLSTPDGLVWVRSRAAEVGGVMRSPVGPVRTLSCVSGVLVGGDSWDELIVMNPAADAGVRRVDFDRYGSISAIAGARGIAWVLDASSGVADLIAV